MSKTVPFGASVSVKNQKRKCLFREFREHCLLIWTQLNLRFSDSSKTCKTWFFDQRKWNVTFQLAFEERMFPKLNAEIQFDRDQETRERALKSLCDLSHNQVKAYQICSVSLDFERTFLERPFLARANGLDRKDLGRSKWSLPRIGNRDLRRHVHT